jgi:membrane protease YdiL (CAAX protease family)
VKLMTIAEIIAEVPSIACMVVTLAAYAADGAWRDLRKAECGRDRRSGTLRFAVPAIIGLIVIATIVLFFPAKTLPQDEVPNASYGAKNALIQLAINTVLVAPFVGWVIWRRKGAAALGLAKEHFLRSLAIGTCVSLACIVMLGRVSTVFWSSPGTWWLLLAMLGVGASEELIFRGLLLSGLSKRLQRVSAEGWSAAIFSVFHLPNQLANGYSTSEITFSLLLLFIWGWCYAAAMRKGKNVPGLALVHAVTNVCVNAW